AYLLLFFLLSLLPLSTLFPYTTLFRSPLGSSIAARIAAVVVRSVVMMLLASGWCRSELCRSVLWSVQQSMRSRPVWTGPTVRVLALQAEFLTIRASSLTGAYTVRLARTLRRNPAGGWPTTLRKRREE